MNIVFENIFPQLLEKLKTLPLNIPEEATILQGFSGLPLFKSINSGNEEAKVELLGSIPTIILMGKTSKQLYFINAAEIITELLSPNNDSEQPSA